MLLRSVAWAAIALVAIAAHPGPACASIRLIDQRGVPFAYEALRGSPLVVTFVSAHCSDACPIVEAQIARSVERFERSPFAVTFLTITLDPERDRVSDMRRFAHEFDARAPRWIFASGTQANVHALMRRFGVAPQRDARGYAAVHSTLVYILDASLHVRQRLLPSGDLNASIMQGILRQ